MTEDDAADARRDEDLLQAVLTRVEGTLDGQSRMRLLLSALIPLAADLTLDGVLSQIVGIARQLTGARYAALGVLNPAAQGGLRTFVHRGMDDEQVTEIGDLPTGHGILGLLTDHPQPLRLHDLTAHPESYGFPEGHPPMHSFLGVPVRIRDRVFGNLYLTEKSDGGDFDQLDEDVVVALAAAAGVAVENARLYEEAGRRETWLAAAAEVTAALSGSDPAAVTRSLQLIVTRAREAAVADAAWLVADDGDGPDLLAVAGPPVSIDDLADVPWDQSVTAGVIRSGRPVSTEDIGADPRALDMGGYDAWPLLGPAIVVPLHTEARVRGALALGWRPDHVDQFHLVDPRLAASFAEQAALALAVMRSREAQQRLRLVEDRDRIGRDLHDLVIQRLFAVGLSLQSLVPLAESPRVSHRLEQAIDDLDATVRDIRRTIFALGSGDAAADLQTAVTRLVDRAATTLKFRPELTLEGPLRTMVAEDVAPHLLAVLGETLSNAARHSGADRVQVRITVGRDLELVVADTGGGLPAGVTESGLRNVRERAAQLGGSCRVDSSDEGTVVTWSVPLG